MVVWLAAVSIFGAVFTLVLSAFHLGWALADTPIPYLAIGVLVVAGAWNLRKLIRDNQWRDRNWRQ